MVVIGACTVRPLSIILVSFLVISGTIVVMWGMDTTGRWSQLERKYGSETSPSAARTAA
jgi:hypothetical protein